jgi:anti-sigma factor RsiW
LRAASESQPISRRLLWRRVAIAASLALVAGLMWVGIRAWSSLSGGDLLVQEVIGSHLRSLMAAQAVDILSSDQHTVKPWFNGKLDFSPPVHDLAREGFPLVGGRLDYLDQRPVAALVYRRQQHTINLFVWPAGGSAPHAVTLMSRQGFNMADWSVSGMRYWAVSDLNASEMQAFAQLVRQKIND